MKGSLLMAAMPSPRLNATPRQGSLNLKVKSSLPVLKSHSFADESADPVSSLLESPAEGTATWGQLPRNSKVPCEVLGPVRSAPEGLLQSPVNITIPPVHGYKARLLRFQGSELRLVGV